MPCLVRELSVRLAVESAPWMVSDSETAEVAEFSRAGP